MDKRHVCHSQADFPGEGDECVVGRESICGGRDATPFRLDASVTLPSLIRLATGFDSRRADKERGASALRPRVRGE